MHDASQQLMDHSSAALHSMKVNAFDLNMLRKDATYQLDQRYPKNREMEMRWPRVSDKLSPLLFVIILTNGQVATGGGGNGDEFDRNHRHLNVVSRVFCLHL